MSDLVLAVRLMEHLVVPTFVLDSDGRVIIWNRACERLTGVSAAEVVGTSEHWRALYDLARPCLADLVLRGEAGRLDGLYAEHSSSEPGHVGLSAENWCVMPRLGSRRYLAFDAGPIFDEAGELIAVVETLRDITAQKEAQLALEALASSDGLTGLANRRRFDEHLGQEWRRAARDGQPLSLLMIDIDHFKKLNDAAGHPAGDDCLRQVAAAIAGQMFRAGDQAARYGGEEFAVVMPSTDLAGALIVADRIMSAIAALDLRHPAPEVAGRVTASIGAACLRPAPGPAGPADLIERADAALYRAKRDGRNTVAAPDPEPGRADAA